MKTQNWIITAVFLSFCVCTAVFAEQEKGEPEEEEDIIVPFKTIYAPQEREAILGFDYARADEANKLVPSLELEYSFYDTIELDLEIPAVYRDPKDTGSYFGIGDIETGVKVKLFKEDRFHLSGGFSVTWPSGDKDKELGEGKIELGPYVAIAKGIGPVSLLGSVGYERTVSTQDSENSGEGEEKEDGDEDEGDNNFNIDAAIAYTFPCGLSPILELNSALNNKTIVTLIPGLIYAITDNFEIRGGVQFPVTKDKEFDWNAIVQFLYEFN